MAESVLCLVFERRIDYLGGICRKARRGVVRQLNLTMTWVVFSLGLAEIQPTVTPGISFVSLLRSMQHGSERPIDASISQRKPTLT